MRSRLASVAAAINPGNRYAMSLRNKIEVYERDLRNLGVVDVEGFLARANEMVKVTELSLDEALARLFEEERTRRRLDLL